MVPNRTISLEASPSLQQPLVYTLYSRNIVHEYVSDGFDEYLMMVMNKIIVIMRIGYFDEDNSAMEFHPVPAIVYH